MTDGSTFSKTAAPALWKIVRRNTTIFGNSFQIMMVILDEVVTMDEEDITPFPVPAQLYRKQKPDVMICWGRGVKRTPVSELPDFSNVEEFERLLDQESRIMSIGRGRGRARSRGGSNVHSQIAPDVDMQSIRDQCQQVFLRDSNRMFDNIQRDTSSNRMADVDKKCMRCPKSQSILSTCKRSEPEVSNIVQSSSSSWSSIPVPLSDNNSDDSEPATDKLLQVEASRDKTRSASPRATDRTFSSASCAGSDLGRPLGSRGSALPTMPSVQLNSASCGTVSTQSLTETRHTTVADRLLKATSDKGQKQLFSVANTDSTIVYTNSISLLSASEGSLNTHGEVAASAETSPSSCQNVESATLSNKTAKSNLTNMPEPNPQNNCRSNFTCSSSQTDCDNPVAQDNFLGSYSKQNKHRDAVTPFDDLPEENEAHVPNVSASPTNSVQSRDSSTKNGSVELPNHIHNGRRTSSVSQTESEDSEATKSCASSPGKKCNKRAKNNDFGFQRKPTRNTSFLPNIRNSVSSSSSLDDNYDTKPTNYHEDNSIPKWDPTADYRKGPDTWNADRDFPQLGSSKDNTNLSFAATNASAVNNSVTQARSTLRISLQSRSLPVHNPDSIPSSNLMLSDFYNVLSKANDSVNQEGSEMIKVKLDSVPNGISEKDIEQVFTEYGSTVYRTFLTKGGNCQSAVVHCDTNGTKVIDTLDGTSAFGATPAGDLRCQRI